ncbi:MAG: ABC transporter permease [Dehalococcoidia bacterium]
MTTYLIKRLLLLAPVIFIVYTLVFALIRIIPGDIVNLMMEGGGGRGASQETAAQLRRDLGLDRSIPEQYWIQVRRLARGDLGRSFRDGRPVWHEITRRAPVTLELATLALMVALAIGVPAGVISAVRQDSATDQVTRLAAVLALSVPAFWTGTLLVVLPARWWGYSPPFIYNSLLANPGENLRQVLPGAMTLGAILGGVLTRFTRSALLEVLRQDFIRTAWAKGLRGRSVIVRHALRNALIPVVTIAGLQLATLLGGSIITESIFNLPGIGALTIASIRQRDYPQLQANLLMFAVVVALVNLVVDLMYAWFDPRIRYS